MQQYLAFLISTYTSVTLKLGLNPRKIKIYAVNINARAGAIIIGIASDNKASRAPLIPKKIHPIPKLTAFLNSFRLFFKSKRRLRCLRN